MDVLVRVGLFYFSSHGKMNFESIYIYLYLVSESNEFRNNPAAKSE